MILLKDQRVSCALDVDLLVGVDAVLVSNCAFRLSVLPVCLLKLIPLKVFLRAFGHWEVFVFNIERLCVFVVGLDNLVQTDFDVLFIIS